MKMLVKCIAFLSMYLVSVSVLAVAQVDVDNVLLAGDGYQLREIVYIDDNGQSRSVELFYINNVEGATNAYLEAGLPLSELLDIQQEVDSWGGAWGSAPFAAKNILAADEPQFTWVIDKRGATITTEAQGQAYIDEFNMQAIIDEERKFPDGDKALSGITADVNARRLFGCSGWRNKNKRFTKDVDKKFSHNKRIGSGIATLNFKGSLDVDTDIDLKLDYRYKRNFICIPYKFRFNNLDAKANYDAQGNFSIIGKVAKNFGNYNWKIAEPKVFDFWFAVGPIPVRLAGKLPIEVGTGDIRFTAQGEVATYKAIHFKGNLHYSCNGSGCTKHSSNHQNLSQGLSNSIGASVSATVTFKPYVHVAIKPYLYGEWFLYLQLGVKPAFPIELFGYYGNLCQDGDNNGTNETVAAALGTIAFEVGVTGEAKIFGTYILRPKYWSLWSKDLLFVDFLQPGSSAFTPLLRPQVIANQLDITLPVSIRSCVNRYASRFPVDYSINWGDGSVSLLQDVATTKSLAHTYPGPGTYQVKVSYKNGVNTTIPVTITGDGWGGGWD
ncbi:PKD domain-containing protein [Marinagarivorans algicola]|uniref:PKD domain-containing protein n=1 Tax=Marinagarivorans algicola TaxID=1513270 RepID=UPI0006B62243|nr:PKD domain-containing protein [Marinagarivorans algicola]